MFYSPKHLSLLFAGLFALLLLSGCGAGSDEENQQQPVDNGASDQSANEPADNEQGPTEENQQQPVDNGASDQSANEPADNQQAPATVPSEPPTTAAGSTAKWEAPTTAGDSAAHPFVTEDFHAAIIVHAKSLYESKLMKKVRSLDTEGAFDDAMVVSLNRETGVDVRGVERYSLFTKSLPGEAREMPAIVMILEFAEAADRSEIAQKTTGVETAQEDGEMKWYIPEEGSRYEMVLCIVNDKTLVYSTDLALAKKTVTAPAADTPLNKRLVELDYSNQHITMVGSNAIFPPALMSEMQEELGEQSLPPAFSDIADVIAQVTGASGVLNLTPDLYLKLGVETTSAETTTKLKTMTNDALVMVKTTLGALALIPPQDMPEAIKKMIPEVLKILAQLKLDQQEKQFEIAIRIPETTLTSFMAPLSASITEARNAARSMAGMNNMKQIGIAFHNFHEVYKRFPVGEFPEGGLIKYKDGKPLLSWRVYLLPFIEQQPLFSQFKLDEPWDSPHNMALLDEMPDVYKSPSSADGTNKTRYLAPVGPSSILGEKRIVRFRDISDGTANTAMLVEAGEDKAVPWTKPEDLTYDPKNPVGSLGKIGDSLTILMADGSVWKLKTTIDAATLLNLFQRNDGNIVDFDRFSE